MIGVVIQVLFPQELSGNYKIYKSVKLYNLINQRPNVGIF